MARFDDNAQRRVTLVWGPIWTNFVPNIKSSLLFQIILMVHLRILELKNITLNVSCTPYAGVICILFYFFILSGWFEFTPHNRDPKLG